jgi:hypothetical protein
LPYTTTWTSPSWASRSFPSDSTVIQLHSWRHSSTLIASFIYIHEVITGSYELHRCSFIYTHEVIHIHLHQGHSSVLMKSLICNHELLRFHSCGHSYILMRSLIYTHEVPSWGNSSELIRFFYIYPWNHSSVLMMSLIYLYSWDHLHSGGNSSNLMKFLFILVVSFIYTHNVINQLILMMLFISTHEVIPLQYTQDNLFNTHMRSSIFISPTSLLWRFFLYSCDLPVCLKDLSLAHIGVYSL